MGFGVMDCLFLLSSVWPMSFFVAKVYPQMFLFPCLLVLLAVSGFALGCRVLSMEKEMSAGSDGLPAPPWLWPSVFLSSGCVEDAFHSVVLG